jgi:hypothetical protein
VFAISSCQSQHPRRWPPCQSPSSPACCRHHPCGRAPASGGPGPALIHPRPAAAPSYCALAPPHPHCARSTQAQPLRHIAASPPHMQAPGCAERHRIQFNSSWPKLFKLKCKTMNALVSICSRALAFYFYFCFARSLGPRLCECGIQCILRSSRRFPIIPAEKALATSLEEFSGTSEIPDTWTRIFG